MCKYCHEPCEGTVCPKCRQEQNSILWDNEECISTNSIFAIWSIFRFISFIASAILLFFCFKNGFASNHLWLFLTATICSTVLFNGLRKMYHKQMGIIIDREMRKNHQ